MQTQGIWGGIGGAMGTRLPGALGTLLLGYGCFLLKCARAILATRLEMIPGCNLPSSKFLELCFLKGQSLSG